MELRPTTTNTIGNPLFLSNAAGTSESRIHVTTHPGAKPLKL